MYSSRAAVVFLLLLAGSAWAQKMGSFAANRDDRQVSRVRSDFPQGFQFLLPISADISTSRNNLASRQKTFHNQPEPDNDNIVFPDQIGHRISLSKKTEQAITLSAFNRAPVRPKPNTRTNNVVAFMNLSNRS